MFIDSTPTELSHQPQEIFASDIVHRLDQLGLTPQMIRQILAQKPSHGRPVQAVTRQAVIQLLQEIEEMEMDGSLEQARQDLDRGKKLLMNQS